MRACAPSAELLLLLPHSTCLFLSRSLLIRRSVLGRMRFRNATFVCRERACARARVPPNKRIRVSLLELESAPAARERGLCIRRAPAESQVRLGGPRRTGPGSAARSGTTAPRSFTRPLIFSSAQSPRPCSQLLRAHTKHIWHLAAL